MTTAVDEVQYRRRIFNHERVNLESHQLIFFDDHSYDDRENGIMSRLEDFCQIVNYAQYIENIDEALHFIEQTKYTTTFIIYSGNLNQIIAQQIHTMKNI